MPEVVIEYCVSCGYLKDAMRIAEAILERHAARLFALRFVMVTGAVFRVHVDGTLVWDGRKDEWDEAVVRDRVAARLDGE